jgi:DNA-binding transcriptional MerR regulator
MAKSLTQITFDFTSVEEPQIPLAETAAIETVAQQPVITPEEIAAQTEEVAETPVVEPSPVLTGTSGKRGRKSLKDISQGADLIQIPEDEILFQKQYYSIGTVATMFRENQSLIRYWETEFDILQPKKNGKGDRFFRPVDIKNLVLIYDLLRRRKFTIEGAKDYLKKNKRAEEKFAMIQSLQKIKGFLLELKANL